MLGSLPVWVSKEKIFQNLPESFKGEHEDVRGTFYCNEIKCNTPKDYQAHSETYSEYKSHDTYKDLFVFHQMVGLHLLATCALAGSVIGKF